MPTGEPTSGCADNLLVRPTPRRHDLRRPDSPLTPGWCTLSMLFSDWDRSGRRDLRVSNDRHYYRSTARSSSGASHRASRRASTRRDDGWARLQLWGMGIASQDVTGDGYPEVYLTSQGDNKLQTLADGPSQPAYEDIALERGVTAHRPYAGGDDLPSTAWHPEFADVNNDGFLDLFVSKGNVGSEVGLRREGPEQPVHRPGRRHVRGGRRGRRDRALRDCARGAALVDLNLDGAAGPRAGRCATRTSGLWRNVGTGDADDPGPDGPLARRWTSSQPGAEPRRDRRVARDRGRRPDDAARGHRRRRPRERPARLDPRRARDGRERPTFACHWPDGEVGSVADVAADTFAAIERGATEPTPWTP